MEKEDEKVEFERTYGAPYYESKGALGMHQIIKKERMPLHLLPNCSLFGMKVG